MEEKCITVAKLKEILDKLIAEGKGDYTFAVEKRTQPPLLMLIMAWLRGQMKVNALLKQPMIVVS